ncbi:hypothetical protein BH10ACT8_BH10ACT8_26440 [soil metagenome]|jgi:hypothetical protein
MRSANNAAHGTGRCIRAVDGAATVARSGRAERAVLQPETLPGRTCHNRVVSGDTAPVIFETDQALAATLKAKVLGAAPVGIAFDPPSRPWIQSLKGPTVNLFLFDLKENASRRESAYEPIRDADGVVIGHRPPMQRWDLHYTVTVFAPQVVIEHKILSAVLRYFASIDVLPVELMPTALSEVGYPVTVSTGSGPKRGMFLNYAGDMKVGFEMAITVPIPSLPAPPPAPPVQQAPRLDVGPVPGTDPARTAQASESVPPRAAAPNPPPEKAEPEKAEPAEQVSGPPAATQPR